jgi:hypothetical protein
VLDALHRAAGERLAGWNLPYHRPRLELVGTLWPAKPDTRPGT